MCDCFFYQDERIKGKKGGWNSCFVVMFVYVIDIGDCMLCRVFWQFFWRNKKELFIDKNVREMDWNMF